MLLGKIAHMSYSMMFQEAKNLGNPSRPGSNLRISVSSRWLPSERDRGSASDQAFHRLCFHRADGEKRLIVRKRDAMHPRIVKVYVTEKLRGCYRTFEKSWRKMRKAIIHGFTEEEKGTAEGLPEPDLQQSGAGIEEERRMLQTGGSMIC